MDLAHITIRPADPERHFAAIAALMTSYETEPTTEQSLADWYKRQLEHGIRFAVALSPEDKLFGFNELYRLSLNREGYYGMSLIIEQEFRRQGLGSLLFNHLLAQAAEMQVRTLITWVRDTCDEGIRFATRFGFVEKKHSIEMMLDLKTWDDSGYESILHAQQEQGFRFTNMVELGDTQEARHKLYELNSTAAATDPGNDGDPPWATFEDFERYVCSASWYSPDAQIIAIDTHTGDWAAMSAIIVFAGADHAYNLFTGTDVRYRGQKLAQAVKALALRKARTFGVGSVRTSHNSENAVMIAIDTKLGYVRTSGMLVMEKELEHVST